MSIIVNVRNDRESDLHRNGRTVYTMKKGKKSWRYEAILNACFNTLLDAYCATMHSDMITVIYTVDNKLMICDLSDEDVRELARLTDRALATQAICKKRIISYSKKAKIFADVTELEALKADFPSYSRNNGYLAEFLYRIKVNGEAVEDIKKSDKSVGYDIASDTKDGRQIKFIDKGATFTQYDHLLKACIRKNYNVKAVEEAINTIKSIYAEA